MRPPCKALPSVLLLLAMARFDPATGADAPAPTHAASVAVATCGNGHLDAGETCGSCAADCVVHPCKPAGKPRTFDIDFDPPAAMRVSSITVLVGYDSRRISLPGSAGAESVGQRLGNKQDKAIVVTNDLDYALRAVFTRPGGIDKGRLFTLTIDSCQDAPAPAATHFGCVMEGCAAASGNVAGCGCRVSAGK